MHRVNPSASDEKQTPKFHMATSTYGVPMEDLHSCIRQHGDVITAKNCQKPSGDTFEGYVKNNTYDEVLEEIPLEVKQECAKKEDREVLSFVDAMIRSGESAKKEHEGKYREDRPIAFVNHNQKDIVEKKREGEDDIIIDVEEEAFSTEDKMLTKEERRNYRPINVNRRGRAAAVRALGLPPEDSDSDDDILRPWWIPKERPFQRTEGPPSTAIKRFQERFKKWLGLE